jgi:outer membrane murein-binding lipoprotein Lpp
VASIPPSTPPKPWGPRSVFAIATEHKTDAERIALWERGGLLFPSCWHEGWTEIPWYVAMEEFKSIAANMPGVAAEAIVLADKAQAREAGQFVRLIRRVGKWVVGASAVCMLGSGAFYALDLLKTQRADDMAQSVSQSTRELSSQVQALASQIRELQGALNAVRQACPTTSTVENGKSNQ